MSRDAGTSQQTAVRASLITNSVQCNAIQYNVVTVMHCTSKIAALLLNLQVVDDVFNGHMD